MVFVKNFNSLQTCRNCCLSMLFAFSGVLATNTNAAPIVDWGGDYVASYTPLDLATPSTGSGWVTYNYSDSTPISPAGPTFYGAISLIDSSGSGTPGFISDRLGIAHAAAGDSLRIGAAAGATQMRMIGLIFFKKEDFLNGAGGVLNFSDGGSISMNTTSSVGTNPRQIKGAVYALLGGEWKWYVSGTSAASALTIEDPANITWAPYEIDASTAPLEVAPGSSAYTVYGNEFEDIGAIGFYFNYFQTNNNFGFFMNSFQAEATVIPEPGTLSLLVGALLLLMNRRGH